MHYLLCTLEKVYCQNNLSDWQFDLIKTRTVLILGIANILKLLRARFVDFIPHSTLIPEELELEVANQPFILPPVVYSHFLLCLCHFRLNNVNQCYNSLRDLQLTISENYFIFGNIHRSNSYNCLGVAYQLSGQRALAEHAFRRAIQIAPTWNYALQRL